MIALTYGKLEVGLATNSNKQYWTPLKEFVRKTWLHASDEGQQSGMPVVSRHSARAQPFALEMCIGDLKQHGGGVGNKEQEDIGVLRMLRGTALQRLEVESFLAGHLVDPVTAELTPQEEDGLPEGCDDAIAESNQPAPDPGFTPAKRA